MTAEEKKNKVLFIFYNYKETADALPKKHRGEFWNLVITYAFDGEYAIKNDLESCNKYVKIAFLSIKNLIRLNKKAGSQNGKSNNPSGLSNLERPNIGPNIGANIGPIPYIKENKINKNKINKEKELQNNLKDDTEDKNNPKWTDRDRWEKGWIDRTKYIICYKGIVPKDWKPTMEDYEKSGGSPYYYDNLPKRYRFEGKAIRLDEKDYNKWKKEFDKLDLEKELYGLDGWALENFKDDKSKLFWVIHGMLVKKQKEKIKNNPDLDKYWI